MEHILRNLETHARGERGNGKGKNSYKEKKNHHRIVFLTPNYIVSMTGSQLSLII